MIAWLTHFSVDLKGVLINPLSKWAKRIGQRLVQPLRDLHLAYFAPFFLITAVLSIWNLTAPSSWSVCLTLGWFIRLTFLRPWRLLFFHLCLVLLLTGQVLIQPRQSRLDPNGSLFQLTLKGASLRVNGDLVKGDGWVDGEYVKWSYTCQSAQEQSFFQNNTSDLTLEVQGGLEPLKVGKFSFSYDEGRQVYGQSRGFYRLKIKSFKTLASRLDPILVLHKGLTLTGHVKHLVDQLIFGQVLDASYTEPFQEMGLYFFIMVSGVHVKWLLDLARFLAYRLGLRRSFTRVLLAFLSLVLLLLLGRFSLGVVKQVTLINGRFRNRRAYLAAFGLALLLWNPFLLYSLGFQLSVCLHLVYLLGRPWLASGFALGLLSYHYFQIHLLAFCLLPALRRLLWYLILPLVWLNFFLPFLQGPSNIILEPLYNGLDRLSGLSFFKFMTGRLDLVWYGIYFACLLLLQAIFLARGQGKAGLKETVGLKENTSLSINAGSRGCIGFKENIASKRNVDFKGNTGFKGIATLNGKTNLTENVSLRGSYRKKGKVRLGRGLASCLLVGLAVLSLSPKPAWRLFVLDEGAPVLLVQSGYTNVLVNTGGRSDFAVGQDWRAKASSFVSDYGGLALLRGLGIGHLDALVVSKGSSSFVGDLDHVLEAVPTSHVLAVDRGQVWQADVDLSNGQGVYMGHAPLGSVMGADWGPWRSVGIGTRPGRQGGGMALVFGPWRVDLMDRVLVVRGAGVVWKLSRQAEGWVFKDQRTPAVKALKFEAGRWSRP